MKEIYTKSMSELLLEINKFQKSRSSIFRGQKDEKWKLLPKSGRPEFQKNYRKGVDERKAFEAWKRYAYNFLSKVPIDDWDWLALAQHYGFATRLLDWTKNPLNAMFFAISDNYNRNAAIFVLDIHQRDLEIIGNSPFDVKDFYVYFPKGLSSRIISQRGLFTISEVPDFPLDDLLDDRLYKIIVDKSALIEIDETLEFYGINKVTIYQDLNSLSEYLNDFVKKGRKYYQDLSNIIFDKNELDHQIVS